MTANLLLLVANMLFLAANVATVILISLSYRRLMHAWLRLAKFDQDQPR
jgi:hypothetical protein